MNARIAGIGSYLPARVVTNEEIAQASGIDARFLEEKVGIASRHVAGDGEPTSAMAVRAAEALFAGQGGARAHVDVLIVCTQNPDYRLPTTACIVQHRLGLSTACAAFDVNLGCSGFVYCLAIAQNFIRAGGARTVLLIMADQYTKITGREDRVTAGLFGDAACAVLVNACEEGYGVLDYLLGTDGGGAEKLILYNSGVARDAGKPGTLYMDGRAIYKFAVTTVVEQARQAMDRAGLAAGDVRHVVFHQANKYMLEEMRQRLGLRPEQVVVALRECANTVSASIPLALEQLYRRQEVHRGDVLLLCGFGVGLSWGCAVYKEP